MQKLTFLGLSFKINNKSGRSQVTKNTIKRKINYVSLTYFNLILDEETRPLQKYQLLLPDIYLID